jgi:hypothetical protein
MTYRLLVASVVFAAVSAVPSQAATARPADSGPASHALVPGWADQVTSIRVALQAMPVVCAGLVCPTPVRPRHPVRPRKVTLTRRAWFVRLTKDINGLPAWQETSCELGGDGARLYHVVFHYTGGDQWTITVDRGPLAEMVFPNNGDPDNGGRATCVFPRTAARLNHDLDRALSHPLQPPR